MSQTKGSGTTQTNPQLTGQQQATLNEQTNAYLSTFLPAYQQYAKGIGDVYNKNLQGVTQAGQNLGSTAGQAQGLFGTQGQQAYETGIQGLKNLFSPEYEQQQINAALIPAQQQYQQNIANQGAQFGGAGQLGSARQALAGQQLASTNAQNQSILAAQVANQVAQQRSGAASNLAQLGSQGLQNAIGAANTVVGASQIPMNQYSQLGQLYGGMTNWAPNYSGTIGSQTKSTSTQTGNVNAGTVAGTIGGVMEGAGALGNIISSTGVGNAISSGVSSAYDWATGLFD